MSDLSIHLLALARDDHPVVHDSLMVVVGATHTPDGTIQYTLQDVLVEAAHKLLGEDHEDMAFKGTLLLPGHRYSFKHVRGSQKYIRETVATYVDQNERELVISGRTKLPHDEHFTFGTSELPKTWIVSIEEVDPRKVPIRANKVTEEMVDTSW